jgi:DNA modification methylase
MIPTVTILEGDVRARLRELPEGSVDSCVTDPPYELGFMGKKWDSSGISYSVEVWKEVCRVLKPGAHLLAFGGSRTYHRLACAIEDAGFEIRDQIMWLYGSGFPKSLDISKAIDKAAGVERDVVGERKQGFGLTSDRGWNQTNTPRYGTIQDTVPATSLAQQWDGWGTALKPAHEPIVVARKPLEGTVVNNVLKHRCGGINVGACRIEGQPEATRFDPKKHNHEGYRMTASGAETSARAEQANGRWPANVIHDGSEEVLAEFEKAGERPSGAMKKPYTYKNNGFSMGAPSGETRSNHESNTGSAARFFYCAKASRAERNRGLQFRATAQRDESRIAGNPGGDNPRNRGVKPVKNFHPTVKPLALMCYLVRLVTPPGGSVLDCFSGSGSTLIAAAKEGFDSIGTELNPEYIGIAKKRILGDLGMLVEVKSNAP